MIGRVNVIIIKYNRVQYLSKISDFTLCFAISFLFRIFATKLQYSVK